MTPAQRPDPAHSRRSERRLHALVLLPTLASIGLILSLAVLSIELLGAVRAYASGESQWSKGRAQAVQALLDFGHSGDVADYRRFEQALRVPLADRQAREAMDRRPPDLDAARDGLLAGDNHVDDIEGMVFLYRRFGQLALFQEPLRHWREGDALIDELRAAAARLQAETARTPVDEATRRALLDEVRVGNERLLAAERGFTQAIGEVGRLVQRLLVASLVGLALLVAGRASSACGAAWPCARAARPSCKPPTSAGCWPRRAAASACTTGTWSRTCCAWTRAPRRSTAWHRHPARRRWCGAPPSRRCCTRTISPPPAPRWTTRWPAAACCACATGCSRRAAGRATWR
jgi:hypothetical protein